MGVKKYCLKHIGKVFTSKEGYKLEVIEGGSKKDLCIIKIDDKYTREVSFINFKTGRVKNFFHPSVFDKGFIGVGIYSLKEHKEIYLRWRAMLSRAYSVKYHIKYPSYKEVEVENQWLDFQIFAKWSKENYVKDWELDKDLLNYTNNKKLYSEETSLYIPGALNKFLANTMMNNSSGKIGCFLHKTTKKYQVNISDMTGKTKYLGTRSTLEEASELYKAQREIYANIWKERMIGILPQKAVDNIK